MEEKLRYRLTAVTYRRFEAHD